MKYLLILLAAVLLFSCSEKSASEENGLENNFSISGIIKNASNTKITVEAMSQQGTITVAEGQTDGSGAFELHGNIPGMGLYQFRLGEAPENAIPLTLVPDDQVKMNTSFENFVTKPNVSGTKWAKTMNEYMLLFNDFLSKQQELNSMQATATEDEMAQKFFEYRKDLDAFALKKMKADPSNPFNLILSSMLTPMAGFKYWNPENLEVLKSVSLAYKKEYKDSPIAQGLESQVFSIENAYQDYLDNNSGTKTAPEIELKNPEGKVIKLSSLRGKYVLIDFWASWCGPCRKENPNVVRLYNKYKNKGFTIYSVSLDNDVNAWKNAIAQDGLIWPNHVSDLLQWNSTMPALYGFQGIPYTVMLDKEGKIIATGLRGESLEQKLVELLGK